MNQKNMQRLAVIILILIGTLYNLPLIIKGLNKTECVEFTLDRAQDSYVEFYIDKGQDLQDFKEKIVRVFNDNGWKHKRISIHEFGKTNIIQVRFDQPQLKEDRRIFFTFNPKKIFALYDHEVDIVIKTIKSLSITTNSQKIEVEDGFSNKKILIGKEVTDAPIFINGFIAYDTVYKVIIKFFVYCIIAFLVSRLVLYRLRQRDSLEEYGIFLSMLFVMVISVMGLAEWAKFIGFQIPRLYFGDVGALLELLPFLIMFFINLGPFIILNIQVRHGNVEPSKSRSALFKITLINFVPGIFILPCILFWHSLPGEYSQVVVAAGDIFIMFLAFALSPIFVNMIFRPSNAPSELLAKATVVDIKSHFSSVKIIKTPLPEANAIVTGVLPWFRLLYLTKDLVENMDDGVLNAVISHEIGHVKYKHSLLLLFSIIFIMITIPSFLMVYPLSSMFVGLVCMAIILKVIRTAEHKADLFAASVVGKEQMIKALTKITEYNRGQGKKSGAFSTHPSLDKRIQYLINKCTR